jgi:hypothetical protein
MTKFRHNGRNHYLYRGIAFAPSSGGGRGWNTSGIDPRTGEQISGYVATLALGKVWVDSINEEVAR